MDDLDLGSTIKGFIPGQKVLNRYSLVKILGRGGMGVVWLARDEELEREVALKFLPEVVALDAEAVADLKRETRRNLALTHPHIVRIHDFVSDKRTAAISMEFVDGSTLSALKLEAPDRRLPVERLKPWVAQWLDAMHYAHTKAKVVHRDLKPANLMVTGEGDLKVTDFGIASSITDSVSRVSKQAGSSGTPIYMSPQQMMGEKPAVTDDIYAIGATLFELLTGKPPFHSGNILMQVQSKQAPRLSERLAELGVADASVDPAWEATIAACLAKDPAERPQSVSQVAERLGLLATSTRTVKPESNPEPKPVATPEAVPTRSEPAPVRESSVKPKKPFPVLGLAAILAAPLLFALIWDLSVNAPERRRKQVLQAAEEAAARGMAEQLQEQATQERNQREEFRRAAAIGVVPVEGRAFIVSDVGVEMLPIPAGRFAMGSASGGGNDGRPVTQVTISRPFWLGKTEVTQAQWEALMGSNPSYFKGSSLPVEQVSWEEAMAFCLKLTERERAAGRLPEGYEYTLPTEAQWEYACRAGTTGDYAGNLDAMGWYDRNSGSSTKPVGQKQANVWGLHDMHGNVRESCLDWSARDLPGGSVTDPRGPGSGSFRVNRGGSWRHPALLCTSDGRGGETPYVRTYDLGFRVALSSVRSGA